MNKNMALLLAAAALLAAQPARAVDGISLEVGTGDSTDMGRVGVQWKWKSRWFDTGNWHLGGYWDLQLGYWKGNNSAGLVDLGLTPTFRVQGNAPTGPYVEAAIGFHYLSRKRIHANKRFGTNFNFGDHVGAGVRFGERGRYDLGVRLQHLSNGGIKDPNPGINFAQLRFQYHFD